MTLVLSRFSSSHLLPWLPSHWVLAVLASISLQVERKLCVLVSPLELGPPWWCWKGGPCAMALLISLAGVLWAVQHFVCERSLWHSVLELDLLETGPWWKPSLHNTFSHLQAVVTGTVQEPSTTFCRCLARRLQIWRTRLNSSCFNWRQCCGSVDQWVGDDLVSSQPCSLVIAPQGCVVKGFLEAVSIKEWQV